MKISRGLSALFCAGMMALTVVGCKSTTDNGGSTPAPAKDTRAAIRINAGGDADWTDAKGNVWKAEYGFEGGSPMDRDPIDIEGGKDLSRVYSTEIYGMDSCTFDVPNGKWTVKLHFCEAYEGIQDETGRVFTYTVKDGLPKDGKVLKEAKNFSPWKAAGGASKAYVDSIPVEITSGKLSITFDYIEENPQINGIEILPR